MKKIYIPQGGGRDFWLRIPMNNESAGRHLCMDDVDENEMHVWLESGYGGCWTLVWEKDGAQRDGIAAEVPASQLGYGTYSVVMAGKFVNGDSFRTKRQLFIRLVDREDQADAEPTMYNETQAYWAGPAVLSEMLSRDGLNTYELAVIHGYTGTVEEFLEISGLELQDLMVTKPKLSLEVQELLDKVNSFDTSNDADLDIDDEENNTLVRFSEGHVKTKNFDSRDLKTFVGDADSTDLDFTDEGDNIIMRVANGHVRTKRFDSSTVLKQSDLDTLYDTLRELNHPLRGKKVAFLGDSITDGTGASSTSFRYSTVLSSMAGCTEVNLGIGGTCLAANTKNGLTSQRFITRATSANLSSCDVVIVFGGTNDFSYDIKPVGDYFSEQTITGNTYMGTTKRIPNPDNESFSGALHELITQIRTVSPSAQIIFVQMLNRGHWNSTPTRPNSAESNANGDYMQDFRDAVDAICKSYCIPVIPLNSLFEQDWTNDTPSSLSSMDSDGIHPNNLGHRRIAEIIYNWAWNNIII